MIFSASQGQKFLRCASQWHFTYVQGFRQPPNQPMLDGTAVHSYVQFALAYALAVPDDRLGNAARALLRFLPRQAPPELVEVRFKIAPEMLGFPLWTRGIIDLITVERTLVVQDHKTRSHLKWALTALELRTDFQIRLYALVAARTIKWRGPVIVRHNNVMRSKPHTVRVVETELSAADLDQTQDHVRRTFGAMAYNAILPIEQISWNKDACDDYKSRLNPDGCEHRHRCLALGRAVGGDLAHWYNVHIGGSSLGGEAG